LLSDVFGFLTTEPNKEVGAIPFVVSPSLTFRTDVQPVQIPAKKARGLVSSNANQTGGFLPLVAARCLDWNRHHEIPAKSRTQWTAAVESRHWNAEREGAIAQQR
jgi:hypothetical protein